MANDFTRGIRDMQKRLSELADFTKSLDGDIATVRFTPGDSESVEAAVREMEAAIDAKAARYRSNSAVMDLAKATKANFAERIRNMKQEDGDS